MRFKKPQVRYADTPQPATPYQTAGQVWDDRIGSARVQAKNWRFMAFGCLTLALLMAGGLVWRSAQSIVTPYVVEVDNAGQVRAVGEAATPYRPNDAQTAHHIARFVTLVRSLSIDPIVVRQNWLDAYDYTTDKGAVVLATRLSTCAGRNAATSTALRRAWNGGRPWCPSCSSRRAPKNACARTRWASTSTAFPGAASWILPKEQNHEPVFPLLRFAVDACCPGGLRHARQAAADHLAR